MGSYILAINTSFNCGLRFTPFVAWVFYSITYSHILYLYGKMCFLLTYILWYIHNLQRLSSFHLFAQVFNFSATEFKTFFFSFSLRYQQAAAYFALTQISFEEVSLKFLQVKDSESLKMFLQKKMINLKANVSFSFQKCSAYLYERRLARELLVILFFWHVYTHHTVSWRTFDGKMEEKWAYKSKEIKIRRLFWLMAFLAMFRYFRMGINIIMTYYIITYF